MLGGHDLATALLSREGVYRARERLLVLKQRLRRLEDPRGQPTRDL